MKLETKVMLYGIGALLLGFVLGSGGGAKHAQAECIDVIRDLSDALREAAEGYPYRGQEGVP